MLNAPFPRTAQVLHTREENQFLTSPPTASQTYNSICDGNGMKIIETIP